MYNIGRTQNLTSVLNVFFFSSRSDSFGNLIFLAVDNFQHLQRRLEPKTPATFHKFNKLSISLNNPPYFQTQLFTNRCEIQHSNSNITNEKRRQKKRDIKRYKKICEGEKRKKELAARSKDKTMPRGTRSGKRRYPPGRFS